MTVHSLSTKFIINLPISDSGDSGYDEYEDEYAHIITENSARDKVDRVMTDFRPVDLPELLVITGRACTRILSGYEKNKMEEEKILSSLRTEGLLAKPGGKAKSGMSFEIVDMNSDMLNASFASTSSFLPSHKLRLKTKQLISTVNMKSSSVALRRGERQ